MREITHFVVMTSTLIESDIALRKGLEESISRRKAFNDKHSCPDKSPGCFGPLHSHLACSKCSGI